MVRKVLIPVKEFQKIEQDKARWLVKGLETGGYVFGRIHPNGVAEVTHVIDGGPKAERTPASFSGDNEYATRIKERLQEIDPEIRLLGEYHVHPWNGFSALSRGDIDQLYKLKKDRPWFLAFLSTENDFKIWDVRVNILKPGSVSLTNGGHVYEHAKTELVPETVPYQLVESVDSKELFDRILKITKHDLLVEKTVLIVGLGSGGSVIAKYLGCTGIGRFILVDNDDLEVPNLIRHEGGLKDLDRPKVEICKDIIESHNPFAVVETYKLDATKMSSKVEELATQADLIIGSSGSPRVNHILNGISVRYRIPAIYGGAFEKAVGGFVLAVKPYETACFNCLFNLTSKSYTVDKEAAKRYGLDEDELHEQQGLWIDISFPALILSKMALAMLEEKPLDYNLVIYSSDLEIQKLTVNQREDCVVCNEKGWLSKFSSQESETHEHKLSLKEKLRRLFRWRLRRSMRH